MVASGVEHYRETDFLSQNRSAHVSFADIYHHAGADHNGVENGSGAPDVVKAVDGQAEVYLDGGIRRGTDIFKALALGARSVLIGRPLFWGLAVNGEAGVLAILEMLRDELDATMGMCGRPTIDSINIDSLTTVSPLLAMFPQPGEFR